MYISSASAVSHQWMYQDANGEGAWHGVCVCVCVYPCKDYHCSVAYNST